MQTDPPHVSRGGLIGAIIMAALGVMVIYSMVTSGHRLIWPVAMGCLGGAGILAWRSFLSPPLPGYWAGVSTWLGGLSAGWGFGFVVYFVFQATPPPSLAGRIILSVGFLICLLLIAIILFGLGLGPIKQKRIRRVSGTRTTQPALETPSIAEELRPRLQCLRPVTAAAIDEALKSPHFMGSHWLNRTVRTQGTCSQVCDLSAEVSAAYRARGILEGVRWDQLGPFSSRNLDHVWLLMNTPTASVPFLVLRTGEDAYWVAHFPPGQ